MLKNFKICSTKVLDSKLVLAAYKIDLVHLGNKRYVKTRTIPLRIKSNLARPMLVKSTKLSKKEIPEFKKIDKYNDCFVFLKKRHNDNKFFGLDIIKKSNTVTESSDSVINRRKKQEIIKMKFGDKKLLTTKNLLLVSSKDKYQYLNNYTSF